MKHFLRNIAVALFSLTGAAFAYRAWMRRKGPLVRIVVFHDVLNLEWFSASMKFFTEKYHVLTPQEFIGKKFNAEKINILITFDDGYESWATTCLPVLHALNCKGIFFVNSGLLDSARNERDQAAFVRENLKLKTPRKTLSWQQLRLLHEAGHAIGGHTKTHHRLSELQKGAREIEIVEDKRRIETMLGTPLSLFAYPFGNRGDFTPHDGVIAQNAGYTHVFSTEPGFATAASSSLDIPRLCLEEGTREAALSQWVEGAYDVYAKLRQICVR